jgi:hypothetical protein
VDIYYLSWIFLPSFKLSYDWPTNTSHIQAGRFPVNTTVQVNLWTFSNFYPHGSWWGLTCKDYNISKGSLHCLPTYNKTHMSYVKMFRNYMKNICIFGSWIKKACQSWHYWTLVLTMFYHFLNTQQFKLLQFRCHVWKSIGIPKSLYYLWWKN